LKNVGKDYDRAQELYERALTANPDHANNLGNYAVFLKNVRKDYDRAQELYERALTANPDHANNLGNYGIFLKNVRKDNERAQVLYERAFTADPDHASNLGNYAQLLLASEQTDDFEKGRGFLKDVLGRTNLDTDLLVEALFYCVAHQTASIDHPEYRLRLELLAGGRSSGWSFDPTLRWVSANRPKELKFLEAISSVISEDAAIESLETFKTWREWGLVDKATQSSISAESGR
jgi:tetratricopeptide (TPR) repeat protein